MKTANTSSPRLRRAALAAAGLAVAADVLAATAFAARADDAPSGIPETSIATSLPPALADPGGIRKDLASRGITVGANYIGEVFSVAAGGLNRDTHYDGRLELWLDADLGPLAGWKGLTLPCECLSDPRIEHHRGERRLADAGELHRSDAGYSFVRTVS